MARKLEVLFRHRGIESFDFEEMLERVREVFRENGVSVEVTFKQQTLSMKQMDCVDVGSCIPPGVLHGLMFGKVGTLLPPQIVVFIVGKIFNWDVYSGCAGHPLGIPGLVITEAAAAGGQDGDAASGRWVLAHEIVHVLTGIETHSSGLTTMLMTYPATAISGLGTPQLSGSEKAAIRDSDFLGPDDTLTWSMPSGLTIPTHGLPTSHAVPIFKTLHA